MVASPISCGTRPSGGAGLCRFARRQQNRFLVKFRVVETRPLRCYLGTSTVFRRSELQTGARGKARITRMDTTDELKALRHVINENLRVQRGGAEPIPYIDVANVLNNITARQNHAVFGRRGCGKTLLLHFSTDQLDETIRWCI